MGYLYIENDIINGCGMVKILNNEILNIEVSDDIYEQYLNDKDMFVYVDGEIKPNPQYSNLLRIKGIKQEIEEVNEKLQILDLKRIRAVCEDEIRDERTGETWLDFYNSQIYDLRIKLNSLESQL